MNQGEDDDNDNEDGEYEELGGDDDRDVIIQVGTMMMQLAINAKR
jgi:hypothetical protein